MHARIKMLQIQGFRSLGKLVTFDLQSPLTLIYAPNGTGKTTVCEAAEWLLTGQVQRLMVASEFNVSLLSSKFNSQFGGPSVEAIFARSDNSKYLSRSVLGTAESLKLGPSKAVCTSITDIKWLNELASDAVNLDRVFFASEQTIRRWVRGGRFLTVEDLAALMDGDDTNTEKQTQILSDLLGVRHLFDASKALEAHQAELEDSLQKLFDELRGLEFDRNNLIEIEKNFIENPVTYWAGFDDQLSTLETKLLGGSKEKQNTIDRIEGLGAALANQDQDIRKKLTVAANLDSIFLEKKIEICNAQELNSNLRKLTDIVSASSDIIAEREEKITRLQSKISVFEKRIELYPGMKSVVEATLKDFSDSYSKYSNILRLPKHSGLKKLRNLLSRKSISGEPSDNYSHLEVLNIVSREIPQIKENLKKFVAERRKFILRLPDLEKENLYRENLENCFKKLDIELGELQSLEQPLLKLQEDIRSYLSSQYYKSTSDCPACGVSHESPEHLLTAMNLVRESLPKLVLDKRESCKRISNERDFWKGKLDVIDGLRVQIQSIDLEISKATNHEKRLMARLNLYGVSPRDPKGYLDRETAREILAGKVSGVYSALTAIERDFPELERMSLSVINDAAVLHNLSTYQDHLGATVRGCQDELVREKHHLNSLRSQLLIDKSKLRDAQINVARMERSFNDIEYLWESLSGTKKWSLDSFIDLRKELVDKERDYALIRQSLDVLSRYFSSSEALHRRDEIDKKILKLKGDISNIEGRKQLTLSALSGFAEEYNRVANDRLENLTESVTPLFQRMHSNRVYDAIVFQQGKQGAVLKATSQKEAFSPHTDFSQGQRQDLALAIFLARARAVGGTFFLDEPVMHLDDLNRVALLDILRAFTLENGKKLNLVVTTSSKGLARHMIQKFSSVKNIELYGARVSPLTVYSLEGNPKTGVTAKKIYGG
ncbi:AAA family ATPase [Pseudomonas helleri]|uniref:AAA family ATPase n=1 Tax=Pseudomonas helleri TaxID=1608996 RepID=UPI0006542F55|nr:AAA family ATPase [Pseudomonas helleri]KMN06649.1 hypothetical protein TU84_18730 [Pseudomonas helleri]